MAGIHECSFQKANANGFVAKIDSIPGIIGVSRHVIGNMNSRGESPGLMRRFLIKNWTTTCQ